MDVDAPLDDNIRDKDKYMIDVLRAIEELQKIISIREKNQNIVWYIEDSSNKHKLSLHVKCRELVFKNSTALKTYVQILLTYIVDNHPRLANILFKIFDCKIYDNNHSLRMYFSSKVKDNTRVMYLWKNDGKIDKEFNNEYFIKSLLTNVNVDSPISYTVDESEKIQNDFEFLLVTNGFTNRKPVRYTTSSSITYNYGKNDKKLVEKINDRIKDNKEFDDLVCTKAHESSKRGLFGLEFYGKYCPLKKCRHRKNMNGRKAVYERDGEMTMRCIYNPLCKGKKYVIKF